jgi:hypothetical protein
MTRPVSPPQHAASAAGTAARPFFVVLVALCLLAAIAGGLARLGTVAPVMANAEWLGQAAVAHAALMICSFLGTVIALERAVAIKRLAAFLAPLASAVAGLCLLLGHREAAAWLLVAASAIFVGVNVVVVQRQWAAHTLLLLASAWAWLAGNLFFALGHGSGVVLPWWFAFLVLTIAAERLEMTRLMKRRPAAPWLLLVVLTILLAGAAASAFSAAIGGVLFGAALMALALWLVSFDIARRTVFADGLSRYMAVCLLGGYAWLAFAGLSWLGTALGCPGRDAALHALGLGFIFSMMMGHAPVILPAVARVKLEFSNFFYVPLAALHLSLLVRLGFGATDFPLRAAGASLNAAAIALFAATVIGSAIAWKIKHGAAGAKALR